jgi:DNA-directed RNA polymerase specialized sigma24 family protein
MQPLPIELDGAKDRRSAFTTTHWSVVLQAGLADSSLAKDALERLCQSYWYPLYVFVRRQGHTPEDAQDLTQEFFARYLARNYVSLADRSRGKFRTFLLTSLDHFLANEWAKLRTAKRGGGQQVISWDEQEAENRYRAEPADGLAPDKIFEKRWAVSLLEKTLARLRGEFVGSGKGELFEALKVFVWGEKSIATYADIAAHSGMTEAAVKVAVHRLRHRYRELLRDEVGQTVTSEVEVQEELRYLVSVIRS